MNNMKVKIILIKLKMNNMKVKIILIKLKMNNMKVKKIIHFYNFLIIFYPEYKEMKNCNKIYKKLEHLNQFNI